MNRLASLLLVGLLPFAAVAQDLIDRRITSPRHLGVQGGSTAASQEVDAKAAPASTRKPAPVKKTTTPASK